VKALAQWLRNSMRYFSPTALCIEHELIHSARPTGPAAQEAAHLLRKFFLVLAVLPTLSNIRIRHLLTDAGLREEVGDMNQKVVEKALRLFRAGSGGDLLPWIEGWGYTTYIRAALAYLTASGVKSPEMDTAMELQESHARFKALPTGEVPDHDTGKEYKVEPSPATFYTCAAYTVSRRDGKYCLVQHDARIRHWRFRFNFHVGNSFGVVVRDVDDWPFWYTGWPDKRITWRDIAWRLWCPKMEVIAVSEYQVVLKIGREKKTIRF
jgi:hypothetical protein